MIKLNFGDYLQAYNEKKITNTNKSRAVGVIPLYPSGNEVGADGPNYLWETKNYNELNISH